jgi:DNA-binding transcriptional regulator YiaG
MHARHGHNETMPNIASLLKAEITRVARKEVKSETAGLKKSVAPYRSEIASLKRRVQALEQQLRRVSKVAAKKAPVAMTEDSTARRFSAKGLAKHRARLGLSAQALGALIGASALSVYKWEKGEVRPREKYLAAIAQLRRMGKKDAAARLGQLGD